MQRFFAVVLTLLVGTSLYGESSAIPVIVAKTDSGYTLVREGKAYHVRGAGVTGIGLETVAARGGNSVRTWGIETAQETLDEAHALGLTVAMGLPVAAERFGFDYDDEEAKVAQREVVLEAIRQYKDHPALLFWILGNELDMQYTNPRVYDEINNLAMAVRAIDPNHPTTTTISTPDKEVVELVRERAPALNFISIQTYGGLALMPKAIEYLDDGPFMITEWGALGHWEVGKTRWDAPIEFDSTEKGRHYLKFYLENIAPFTGHSLGSYVFLWGQKQERTHTWFSMFTESGESTYSVDVMQYVWTGELPKNQAPAIESVRLARRPAADSVRLRSGKEYKAVAKVSDPDGDPLTFRWRVKTESTETVVGGDLEATIGDLEGLFVSGADSDTLEMKAPAEHGEYRLYFMAFDGQGNAAHANIPFLVY